MSDDEFLLAAAEPGNAGRFERRTNAAFAHRFEDQLPGSAPLRAAYRVRAVSRANIPGVWSAPIGPVRTPDKRVPGRPELISAVPLQGPEMSGRAVRLEWTQPGFVMPREEVDPSADDQPDEIRFSIETSDPAVGLRKWSMYVENIALRPVFFDRFRFDIPRLPPGKEMAFRVVALRQVYDTISPYLDRETTVSSEPSIELRARATGEMSPPRNVTVNQSNGVITLSWSNPDRYDTLTLNAKSSDWVETVELRNDQKRYDLNVSEMEDGLTFSVELVASSSGRFAKSGRLKITVNNASDAG